MALLGGTRCLISPISKWFLNLGVRNMVRELTSIKQGIVNAIAQKVDIMIPGIAQMGDE